MSNKKLHPMLGSSINPDKLALSIKGILGLLITAGLLPFTGAELDLAFTSVMDVVHSIVIAFSAIATLLGVARKLYQKYFVR